MGNIEPKKNKTEKLSLNTLNHHINARRVFQRTGPYIQGQNEQEKNTVLREELETKVVANAIYIA